MNLNSVMMYVILAGLLAYMGSRWRDRRDRVRKTIRPASTFSKFGIGLFVLVLMGLLFVLFFPGGDERKSNQPPNRSQPSGANHL
jgi:predicted PurR-regulated permease PerM